MKKGFLLTVGIVICMFLNVVSVYAGVPIVLKGEKFLVTATKTKKKQSEVASSTTIITGKDLQKEGKLTIADAMRNVPGLSVVQNGSLGGGSKVYLRGANPGHTLVLIDGVEVNDAMASDRSFGFGHLCVDSIERIEIVRGAQSTLYGSDAIAGVINIITKKGKGKSKWEVLLEAGEYNTFKKKIGVRGSSKKYDYSLSLLQLDSDGTSKAANGSEDDGYANTTFSSRFGYDLFKNGKLDLMLRHTDAKYDYDDGANQDDPNKIGFVKSTSGRVGFKHEISKLWDHKLSYSYAENRREYEDDIDAVDVTPSVEIANNWFKGSISKIEWQHNLYDNKKNNTLTGGLEVEVESGKGDGIKAWDKFDRKTIENKAAYIQNQVKLWNKLHTTTGIRVDKHELFGSETTYKVSSAYFDKKCGSKVKVNLGTGFKAPSLYQLYSSYGSTSMKPEKSKGYDLGFEQSFDDGKYYVGLTYFYNDYTDMVAWDNVAYKYKNIGQARTKGYEFEFSYNLTKTLETRFNYTYTDAKDMVTKKELARRAERQFGMNTNWKADRKTNINVGVTHVGSRWNDSGNTTRLKAYTKLDLSCLYDLNDSMQLIGRVDNLFNENYQEVSGYATSKMSIYLGSRVTF